VLGLFDMSDGKRLGERRVVLEPLDNSHGMDEWNGEDRGGKRRGQEKKAKKDEPLDGVNGTEDG